MKALYTNSDHTIHITVKDSSGNAVDLAGAKIIVKVFQKRQTIIATFRSTEGEVWVNTGQGLAEVYLQRAQMKNLLAGKLYAQVEVGLLNANFSTYKNNVFEVLIGEVKIAV